MGFFDLNIPYHESERKILPSRKAALKTSRLKVAAKALELGYTGVAYNHTVKGVMSESDRCQIPRFTLASILEQAPPSLPSAVRFHRQLLNVPVSSPFRQYTRLTVVLQDPSHANALNSGNPVLKTYDLVAVRPVNQEAFQSACLHAKVDIISIDFSAKLPFRLMKSLVKAAVERGVFFEITYSPLILDAQARMHMIPNAKLLVEWTQGKNLIISSGAPSVTELRGSYDAANLTSLFGLTMEKSKAAISKNCRSVIANALRKKHFFKEVIKVEKLPPGEEMNLDDWLTWDPISNAEGELSLDDIGKSFVASCNKLKVAKAINFASSLNGIPSHGLQIKDIISSTLAVAEPFAVSQDLTTELVLPDQKPLSFCSLHKKEPALAQGLVEPSGSYLELPVSLSCKNLSDVDSKNAEPRSLQVLRCTASDDRNVSLCNAAAITCAENTNIVSSNNQCGSARNSSPSIGFSSSPFGCDQSKLSNSASLDVFIEDRNVGRSLVEAIPDNFKSPHEIEAERVCRTDKELPLANCDESLHDNSKETKRSLEACNSSNQIEANRVSSNGEELPHALCEESFHDNCIGMKRFLEERDTSILQIDGLPVEKSGGHLIINNEHLICNDSFERVANGEQIVGTTDLSVAILDETLAPDLGSHRTENIYSVAQDETLQENIVRSQIQTNGQAVTDNKLPGDLPLARGGVKRKTSQRISLFPFKRLISQRPLRKKARK